MAAAELATVAAASSVRISSSSTLLCSKALCASSCARFSSSSSALVVSASACAWLRSALSSSSCCVSRADSERAASSAVSSAEMRSCRTFSRAADIFKLAADGAPLSLPDLLARMASAAAASAARARSASASAFCSASAALRSASSDEYLSAAVISATRCFAFLSSLRALSSSLAIAAGFASWLLARTVTRIALARCANRSVLTASS